MPKRSVDDFKPVGAEGLIFQRVGTEGLIVGAPPVYSNEQIDRIIEAAGGLPDGEVTIDTIWEEETGQQTETLPRKEALKRELELAANTFLVVKSFKARPTPRQLAERFQQIAKSFEDLFALIF